jgi:[protein-PII] uridylyltransferase
MPWAAKGESQCIPEFRGLVQDLRKRIEETRNLIQDWNRQGVGGWFQVVVYTQRMDEILRELFQAMFQGTYPHYSIVALGGYGRKELNLQSDIDLMFLYSRGGDEADERVLQGVQCLWDLGLQIGHSYRSVEEAVAMSLEDMMAKTAYIDTRLLGGSMNPFVQFSRTVARKVIAPGQSLFLEEMYNWMVERHERYGSTMYLLEPNVRESPGSLRDIHTVMWMAKGIYGARIFKDLKRKGLLTPLEFEILERSLDFIWRVRNDVHGIRRRKNDVLSLDIQPQVAYNLGFRDTKELLAVEHFMREYYSRVREIRRVSRAFLLRTMEEVGLRPSGVTPVNLDLVREVMEHPFPTPAHFLRKVHRLQKEGINLLDIPRGFWVPPLHWRVENFNTPEVREALVDVLNASGAHLVFRFLHEIGFMERLFPRWERLTGLMQYDLYHRFTVDEHTLMSLQYAEELEGAASPQLSYLKDALVGHREKRYLLFLAILFHDLGKGMGGGHALRGARMSANLLTDMGFSDEEVDAVQFLVRHHTTMSQIALRRDPTDPRVAMELADICKDLERLDFLYTLTYVDLKAVGPDVWTEWKGALFLDLYLKTREVMEKGITSILELDRSSFRMLVGDLYRHLKGEFTLQEIEDLLFGFPDRYLLQVPREKMVHHLRLLKEAQGKGMAMWWFHNHDVGYTEVTIAKKEHAGDFSKVVGVISSHRLNILSAWVYSREDGYLLEIVHVNDIHFLPVTDEKLWKKLEEEMVLVFQDKIDLEDLIRSGRGSYLSRKEKAVTVKTKVALDNSISDVYSVIEVKTKDKLGLLYLITRTFYALGVTIHMARVSTEGNRAVDAFYVTKMDGTKLTEREFVILSRLLREAIERDRVPQSASAQLSMHYSGNNHVQGP